MKRPTIFNLLYHVAPFAHSTVWMKNIQQLIPRMHVFNGTKAIGIVTGGGLHAPELVMEWFSTHDDGIRYIIEPNCSRRGESVTYLRLMDYVADPDPDQMTFYAHTKGASHVSDTEPMMWWRNAMYHHLLDDVDKVANRLIECTCTGCYRMRHPRGIRLAGAGRLSAQWHYSGAFYWFRNDAIFNQSNWRQPWNNRFQPEFYLPTMISYDRSACEHNDGPRCDRYRAEAHLDRIIDGAV